MSLLYFAFLLGLSVQYIVMLLSTHLHPVEAYRPPFSPMSFSGLPLSRSLGPSSSVRCPLAAPVPLSVLVSPAAPAQPPTSLPPPPTPPVPLPLPLPEPLLPLPEPVLPSLLCGLSLPPAAHGLLLPPLLPPVPAPVPVPDPPEWVGHTGFLSVLAPVL